MSESPNGVTGGCLCGAIRYAIEEAIPPGGHCHCSMCRRSSGAVVLTWISVPRDAFRLTRGKLKTYRSSPFGERRFCPECGAQIAFWSPRQPEVIEVTVGSLDDAAAHPPDHHIFVGDRLPWLRLDEDLAAYPAEPQEPHAASPPAEPE